MKTEQPEWEFVSNLGDVNPIDHGGLFVYRDKTGVYPPEMVKLEPLGEDDYGDPTSWEIHRVPLEPCTFIGGILSDNKYHPTSCAWFATTPQKMRERPQDGKGLADIAESNGVNESTLIEWLTSDNPVDRAMVWEAIGNHHGWANLDSYPLTITDRKEVEEKFKDLG